MNWLFEACEAGHNNSPELTAIVGEEFNATLLPFIKRIEDFDVNKMSAQYRCLTLSFLRTL
ncbi:MAG: hypothetical protein QW808_00015 [Desulfurococcaceae archaeon]